MDTSRQKTLFWKYEKSRYPGVIGCVLRAEKYPSRKTRYIFELNKAEDSRYGILFAQKRSLLKRYIFHLLLLYQIIAFSRWLNLRKLWKKVSKCL